MSEYRFKITYRNEDEYGNYWEDKRYTVSIIAETLEQAKEKLDNIAKNDSGKHKNILNFEAEEIIENEQLQNQLQQKESIIKEVREYVKEHIRIDDEYPDYMEMLIEEYDKLLEILDKEGKDNE